jgi:TetR/AcrR family transcriptional regulator, mexJK operon transcriptional repressor
MPYIEAARPSVGRREARRQAILDVARDCFLSNGYAPTSMSAIAGRVGGSKGTLYNYFDCKEDLFAAVMRRECAGQTLPLFDRIGGRGAEATLYELGRGILAFSLSEAALTIQRVIIAEAGRFPELGHLFYENGPLLVRERLIQLLSGLMASGELRAADPELAATHFMCLVLSNADRFRLWDVAPPPVSADLDRQAHAAVEAFLRAYG